MKDIITYIGPYIKESYHSTLQQGFKIRTLLQEIILYVDCTEYGGGGFITSEDNIKDFEGATLLDIKETNRLLEKTSLKIKDGNCEYFEKYKDMYAIFIDVETTKGVLQFVLYGEGSDYYGTKYKITSEQLNKEGTFTLP